MSNLARYGSSKADRTYPDSDESVFGHMVLELGMKPDEAVQNLRPWVRDLDRSAANSKNIAYAVAFVGAGAGLAISATAGIGMTAILPIASAVYNFLIGQQSAREQSIRESEYLLLKSCPELLKLIYALAKRGMPREALIECYDDLLGSFSLQHRQRAELGLSDELDHDIVRTFQQIVNQKIDAENLGRSIVAETQDFKFDTLYQSTEPTAPRVELPQGPIGTQTRLGAVEIPAQSVASADTQQVQRQKPDFFDFNVLRTNPDDFTGFAIVADPGAGKTRLIKYLARNVLTAGRMSVMDIYARDDDWQGASALVDVDEFLCDIAYDLEEVDQLIKAYRSGQTVFQPHLYVLEEAADTLSEARGRGRGEAKILNDWLSKYLTVTRKIAKRLCLVSVNIKDLTDAIGSAEKRNSMVFIFPGAKGIAKAMTDSYIFKLGTSENAELRAKLERVLASVKRPALVHYRGQWWAAEIPEVNEDGSLTDGSSPAISVQPIRTQAAPKPQDLERLCNAPSAEHEVEEGTSETNPLRDRVKTALGWNHEPSIELAVKVVEYLEKRSNESFKGHRIKSGLSHLETVKAMPADKFKSLLTSITSKGLIEFDPEKDEYTIAQAKQEGWEF